jgi:AcrR family transcriptional regulator
VQSTSTLSLRQRQRVDTLRRLHEAAASLARAGGLTAATVSAIADRAGVSRRTFFNYYASKEDAVLGVTTPSIPERELDRFFDENSDVDQFTRTVRLLIAVVESGRAASGSTVSERQKLLKQVPELHARILQHVIAAEALLENVLTQRLSASGAADQRSVEEARAVLFLANAALRFARWRDPQSTEVVDHAAIEQSVAVFRTMIKEIA